MQRQPCAVCCVLQIIFKLESSGMGELLERTRIAAASGLLDFTFSKLGRMCILSGCDYVEGLPGIGLKTAQTIMSDSRCKDDDIHKVLAIFHLPLAQHNGIPLWWNICVTPTQSLHFSHSSKQ